MKCMDNIDIIIKKFTELRSWEARYRELILLGKQLPKPSSTELLQMQKITGCESAVWFQALPQTDGTFCFQAYSESRIISGLLAILLSAIQHKTAEQLNTFDLQHLLQQLGIAQQLSQTRLNGLNNIVQQIRTL